MGDDTRANHCIGSWRVHSYHGHLLLVCHAGVEGDEVLCPARIAFEGRENDFNLDYSGQDGSMMAMQENHNRELGELSANIKTLTESQNAFRVEMKGSLDQVFGKLNNISENGCAVGKFNGQRITNWKNGQTETQHSGRTWQALLLWL